MDLQGGRSIKFLESLGEVLSRRVHLLGHHLLDGLIGHFKHVWDLVDVLQDGVDQSVADN